MNSGQIRLCLLRARAKFYVSSWSEMEIAMEIQDVVAVTGLPGTVRVNMLANLEALLNVIANSFELALMAFGLLMALAGLFAYHRYICRDPLALYKAGRKAHIGAFLIKFGLLVPGIVNWLVAVARDASLFN